LQRRYGEGREIVEEEGEDRIHNFIQQRSAGIAVEAGFLHLIAGRNKVKEGERGGRKE